MAVGGLTGMWTYKQSTGELWDGNGALVGTGYAGHGPGINNPAMQTVKAVGPLPCGFYTLGPVEAQHGHLGANVARLIPDPANQMFGRGEFFLHGRKGPTDLEASQGCIVQDHTPRMIALLSADRRYHVVP